METTVLSWPLQRLHYRRIAYPDSLIDSLYADPSDPTFARKLERFGQLQPLLVRHCGHDHYQILSEYDTLQALRLLGTQEVVCRIAPETAQAVQLFSLRVLLGLNGSQASPILQAHLLAQAQTALAEEELLELLDLMGHKPNRAQYEELTGLLHLAPKTIQALHRGLLAPRSGKMLRFLPHTDQEALVSLIEAYRAGGSKQNKLIEMVCELTMRENRPVAELVGDWMPKKHEETDRNRPQQLQGILQALTARCWPQRTQIEKDFQGFIQELRLPRDVCLVASPSFEDDTVELRFRFANRTDMRERWQKICRLIR